MTKLDAIPAATQIGDTDKNVCATGNHKNVCATGNHKNVCATAFINPKSKIQNQKSARKGFSLVELLVVISLIVIIMALALPAFNFMTGSRSADGAANIVSAFLGRARAEALAAQRPTGVFFYIDPVTERRAMAIVQATDPRAPDSQRGDFDVWLDLLDSEPILLPGGIDVQLINDGSRAGANLTDRYLGFNKQAVQHFEGSDNVSVGQLNLRYGGVIMFDGNGRLVTQSYGFRARSDARTATGQSATRLTRMGSLMYTGFDSPMPDYDPTAAPSPTPPEPKYKDISSSEKTSDGGNPVKSALGLVLVDLEQFKTKSELSDGDPQITAATTPTAYQTSAAEIAEESWLDENATPMLINRYNGTLVKGQ
jgi:prepilin-type N-terminal cleavage/methylation domain-containing protein